MLLTTLRSVEEAGASMRDVRDDRAESQAVRRRRWPLALLAVLGILGTSLAASASPAQAQQVYREQQGSRGVNTFQNYHNASGIGPRIEPATWVDVSCKVHDPTIPSVNPDGYWYRIASPPWNNQYYAPANTFMNGDPWGGPYTHNTDFAVPDCGAAPPPPPPPPPPATAAGPAASRPKSENGLLLSDPWGADGHQGARLLRRYAPRPGGVEGH